MGKENTYNCRQFDDCLTADGYVTSLPISESLEAPRPGGRFTKLVISGK